MPSIVALFSKSGGGDGANWISGTTEIPDGAVEGIAGFDRSSEAARSIRRTEVHRSTLKTCATGGC
ncbi:MAG TPA: hypothetical protein VN579_01825 [Bryobacteraceae bacterium]|jgi:hypothetical protein|nr:hypothetical protein [Bryobacteraceae bacterium]HXR78367.1 hypothetical protein [Bryobacteraceae bacterium]